MPKSASTVGGAVGAVGDPYNTGWITVNGGATLQTGAAAYTLNNATYTTVTGTQTNEFQYDVYIERNGKRIPVAKTLEQIMERLCIIEPAFEKLEKYPALKAAYDNYKLIEALIQNDEGNNE